jgi:hypothetical protein
MSSARSNSCLARATALETPALSSATATENSGRRRGPVLQVAAFMALQAASFSVDSLGRVFLPEPTHGTTAARTLATGIVEEDVRTVTRGVGAATLVTLADVRRLLAHRLHGMDSAASILKILRATVRVFVRQLSWTVGY